VRAQSIDKVVESCYDASTVIVICGSSATNEDDFVRGTAEELSRSITTNHCEKQESMG
jgi:hypothetical protein